MGCRVRYVILLTILSIVGLSLAWRIVYLNILERDFLLKQSDARIRRHISIPAHRGMITDRHGKPLAISAQVFAIWANPKLMQSDEEDLELLSSYVGLKTSELKARLKTEKSFVYLKRGISPEVANKIKDLKLSGVFLQPEYKRFYPESDVMAHVVGFTNIDDKGTEGLELAYDSYLRGVPGKKEVIKDRMGNIVDELRSIQEPKEGADLTLSLDSRVQYIAYLELKEAMTQYSARAGSIVVLDVDTNEVIAMVNLPSYNPNHIVHSRDGRYRNRAITDQFEPGSTIKAFTIASILASGKFKDTDEIDTFPGQINIDGHVIKDIHNFGTLTAAGAVQKSSNVAIAKMAMQISPKMMVKTLQDVGFGEPTYSGFPGEVGGGISDHRTWKPIDIASLSIGYGVTATTLQLAHAYSVLASGGIKHPIRMIKSDEPIVSERVMKPQLVANVMKILESVTQQGGSGTRAQVSGYRVAGKTGTAHIAGKHGYDMDRVISSFVGIVPVSKPKFVTAVVIYEPKPSHFGGLVAAPVFSKVMTGALRILDIPPDNMN